MPEIRDLLVDAAPPGDAFDEAAVRRRVAQRRRRRGALSGVGAIAIVAVVAGIALAARPDEPSESVLTQQPPTAADADVTAVAFVHEEVWVGGDGFVMREDGSGLVEIPGTVRRIAVGDLVWVAGDAFVTAFDVGSDGLIVIGTRTVDEVADVQPLVGRQVALSSPTTNEVVVLDATATGVDEVERVAVGGSPANLVLTQTNELWVDVADTIVAVDPGTGAIGTPQPWGGDLLAPAFGGAVWSTDGERIVELDPALLSTGQSVALGRRYDVEALAAVEVDAGLFVATDGGIVRLPDGDVITEDEASDFAIAPGHVAWISGGELHVLMADGYVEPSPADHSPQPDDEAWRRDPVEVATRFVASELDWRDVTLAFSPESATVHVTLRSTGKAAEVYVEDEGGTWIVAGLTTFVGQDNHGSQRLGTGDDHVIYDFADPALTPELLVHYGERLTRLPGERGGRAWWYGDVGYAPDWPGRVQVVWRDDSGVAVEALLVRLPPGEYISAF